ncbi:hypothetical protein D6C92_10259 [Aureobasidium pullulans]|nr:hypothetical protein D6C92_10259 [Aureobasidium pullulans]TIA23753.1 hypothetical protein D6C81_02786 [Aureobasidium pullulans]
MADHIVATYFSSPEDTGIEVNKTDLTDPIHLPLPADGRLSDINPVVSPDGIKIPSCAEEHNNFQTATLSSPIKFMLPVDQAEKLETVEHEKTRRDPAHQNEEMGRSSNTSDDTMSPFCPYKPGNKIFLKSTKTGMRIEAEIIKCFPATLSCVMVIRFVEPNFLETTSECVLKLFDRRFSTQEREDWEAAPWTPELEKTYQAFAHCGDAEEFFSYWDAEKEIFDEWSPRHVSNSHRWSAAKWEAYLQWQSTAYYEMEKKAYELMTDLQGKDVPKMFGEVFLDLPFGVQEDIDIDIPDHDEEDSASINWAGSDPLISSIPGLLLQHVDGFHLTDLSANPPREHWQSTVDSAIAALHRIQDCGILNRDVNTRSFIIDPVTHKAKMIDFGLVSFRKNAQDHEEWDRAQATMDEEGAVGLLMQSYLEEQAGGGFVYKESERALRWAYRYNSYSGDNEPGTKEEDDYVEKNLGRATA